MRNYCQVSSCYNKRGASGVKFFGFPRDPTICEQWIEFCRCSQTSEVFYTGGVFAMKDYTICSDHFDPSAYRTPDRLRLEAVPVHIGQTPLAPEVLRARGFSVESEAATIVKHEFPEEVEQVMESEVAEDLMPDHVLVEMLSPEEIKDEFLPEFEEVELEVLMEQQPEKDKKSSNHQHRKGCIFAEGKITNYEERYKDQILQNKNLETLIQKEKWKYAQMSEKLRKTNDLLATKRGKKTRLQKKLAEYKKRGPEALLKKVQPKPSENESDSSIDETNAWW